jgi:hypothetical protein
LAAASFIRPERPRAQEMARHGVSLYGQWPTIVAQHCHAAESDRGTLEPGMTLCCESYVGAVGSAEGVKLKHVAVVTETGGTLLTIFPFEADHLGREVLANRGRRTERTDTQTSAACPLSRSPCRGWSGRRCRCRSWWRCR